MVAQKTRRTGRELEDLPAKNLPAKDAKRVKGGIIINYKPDSANAANATLLLPAVQKARE